MTDFMRRMLQWPLSFKVLYLLIIFDGAATYYGLSLDVIAESNPVMAAAFNFNPLLALVCKLLLSLGFINYIDYAVKVKKIRWPLKVMPLLLLLHTVVAVLHLNWLRSVLVLF